MVDKAQLKELQAEMQELMDDFFMQLRVSILQDGLQNPDTREFTLKVAEIQISQVQHAMTSARDLCVAAQKSLTEEDRSTIVAVEVEVAGFSERTAMYHQGCYNFLFEKATDDEVEMVHQISQYEAEHDFDFTCDHCGIKLAQDPLARGAK